MAKTHYADKRAVKTRNAIRKAFQDLVAVSDYEDISVAAIAAQADVNRKTFYQYYECREDIFIETCDEIAQRYIEDVQHLWRTDGVLHDPEEFYRHFFKFFARQDAYVEQMLCNYTYNIYRLRIMQGCAEANRHRENIFVNMSTEERLLFHDYVMKNIFLLYQRWVELGKDIPLEHLSTFAFKMCDQGMSWLRELAPESVSA